jgi:hypothetical protein
MTRLLDRNANMLAHDYATPPYHLSAVYVAYATGPQGTRMKVGATERQSKDLTEILRGVQRRVRVAVPCIGPRRKPLRPRTFVWVVLALTPPVRHELEQALVERFGDRRFDPTCARRKEFCDPACFGGVMEVIDAWRNALPDALSEALFSEDGGETYSAPRELVPYSGQTEGLWVDPPEGAAALIALRRRRVPEWVRTSMKRTLVNQRERRAVALMAGHPPNRIARLERALRESPAVASALGESYRVRLEGH